MNQTILVNHGVLDLVFELLSQDIDVELMVRATVLNTKGQSDSIYQA